ncbi:MAG: adenylate/guanylate cyclase domain-containing protein [Chryseotalea sp.]
MFRYRNLDLLESIDLETVKSEYQRSYLMVSILLAGVAIVIVNFFIIDISVAQFYGGAQVYFFTILWLLIMVAYEAIILQFLKRKLKAQQTVSDSFKMIHSFIEVTFPSLILVQMVFGYEMLAIIESPILAIYYVFIILSILHLEFSISIFTGAIAAIQFGLIVYFGFEYVTPQAAYIPTSPENSYYIRGILLVLSSAAAGFVARELKNRIQSSFDSNKAKDELANLFNQQVSREVSQSLIKDKGATKRLEATVMFLDIRNFTEFADTHTSDEVIDYQNKFLSPIIGIINQHQGVVLQILGDGVMACFGSPVENALHADMAFQASLAIRKKVEQLIADGEIPVTKYGIGMHSGEIVSGNIGNENRKQFSISGSPVIIASRLEQLTKKYRSDILLSEAVYGLIQPGKIKLNCLGEEPLKGIGKPVKVYAIAD